VGQVFREYMFSTKRLNCFTMGLYH